MLKKNYPDLALLILRVSFALLMMTHGFGKLEKLLAGGVIKFFNFLGLGPTASLVLTVIGEFVAPAMMVLGFYTRWASLVAAFTMGVATFWIHSGDPLGDKEQAMMYFFGFLTVFLAGGGKFTLESVLKKK